MEHVLDRTRVVEQLYQGYLEAHDLLAAGTSPGDIPELADFSARLDEDTTFHFPSLGLALRGREAIERVMVEARQHLGLRETSEQRFAHGDLVVSLNRTTTAGGAEGAPVVAVFAFDGERVTGFWGFSG